MAKHLIRKRLDEIEKELNREKEIKAEITARLCSIHETVACARQFLANGGAPRTEQTTTNRILAKYFNEVRADLVLLDKLENSAVAALLPGLQAAWEVVKDCDEDE